MLAAIQNRVSVRSYAERRIDVEHLEHLLAFAKSANHLTVVPPRIDLIGGEEQVERVLTFMIGSYGLVQKAPHLLVGILPEESDEARVDLGFVLEQVVLEATRLGLGTCWITGSYDAEQAGDIVALSPREVAAAVCALGHPAEKGYGQLHTRVIRRLAGGHRRKPLSEIVFSERWGHSWSPEHAHPSLITVLEHARLAPSAHNAQPWRFILRDTNLALAMVKPRAIDAGIVMSHIALASAAVDRPGEWALSFGDQTLGRALGLPEGTIPVGTFEFSDH